MEGLKTSSTEVTFLLLLGFWNIPRVQTPFAWVTHSRWHPSWGRTKTNEGCTKWFKVLALRLGTGICAGFVQEGILSHNMSTMCRWGLVGLPSPVPILSKTLCQSLLAEGYFMFSSIAAFRGLLVQNTRPFQGGPCSPWSLTRWSESILQKAKVECCKPWCSPAKDQGQSLSGCRSAYLNHISLMAFFCSQWSRTSCDVYRWLPRYHLQLSHGSKAKLVDLQEDFLITLTLCLWYQNVEQGNLW